VRGSSDVGGMAGRHSASLLSMLQGEEGDQGNG
jgi:hypothetical protein